MSFEASTESKNRIFSFRPIRLQCRLYFVFLVIYSCVEPIILAGFPPTTEYGGTDWVTIAPAATILPFPMVTQSMIGLLHPI